MDNLYHCILTVLLKSRWSLAVSAGGVINGCIHSGPCHLSYRSGRSAVFNCRSIALTGQRSNTPGHTFSAQCSVFLPTHPSPKSFCKERCITKYKRNILPWSFLEEIPDSLVLPLHSVHSCTTEGLVFHNLNVTDQHLIFCNQIFHI